MRPLAKIIWPFALAGCLLLTQHMLYGGPVSTFSPEKSAYPATAFSIPSIVRSPLHMLFPFASFRHEVCRRPAFIFSLPLPDTDLSTYRLGGVFFKTNPIGNRYMRLDEQLAFRKGNSYLLLPHTAILPTQPEPDRLPLPTMNLPRAD